VISVRRIILPALFAGLLAVVLMHLRPFSRVEPFRLDVRMSADTEGRARLYFDRGNGFVRYDVAAALIAKGEQTVSFALPDCAVSAFRLWPLDRAGKVTIESASVIGPEGEVVSSLPLNGADGAAMVLETKPGQGPEFRLEQPLALQRSWVARPWRMASDFAIVGGCVALFLLLCGMASEETRARWVRLLAGTRRGLERVPRLVLLLVAAAATALSCHPVIFGGRSFVSPGNGALLLYDDVPTIPGAPAGPAEDPRGSDVGALMWAHVPYSVIEHRAIFRDHEWPLWNRYNYCGEPLLGQGMSMLGDPLHWLPISTGGVAWAWDLKFLLAKTLFALGIGLCVRAATGRLWVAALVALSSSFLGFFSYRFNHPAFFAMCYAPWILHAWIGAAKAPGRVWPWAFAVALANFWQFNTGVMKESTMLIVGLNFTGMLLVLAAERERWRRLGAMVWGCALFVLLSAPCWLVFLDALRHSWTPYDNPRAFQIQPGMALGLFDDLFYRQFTVWENHYNPSANFLILLGCAWAVVHARALVADRVFVALALGAVPSAALAFGVVPASVITRVPFLANVEHVDNTFSVVLLVHLVVLSAYGFRALWESAKAPEMKGEWGLALAVVAMLFALYFGNAQAAPRELGGAVAAMHPSPFFIGYALALVLAVLALPWLVRALRRAPSTGFFLLTVLAIFILHFRHGMWMETKFDYYVMNPQPRADLAARSPGLEAVREKMKERGEPSRLAGFRLTLVPGYQVLQDFEHFAGADALVNRQQRELCEKIGTPPMWGWRWQVGAPSAGPWRWGIRAPGGSPFVYSLCNLWGVRWLVALPCDAPDGKATGDLALTENPNAWPRAFFTEQVIACNSLENFTILLKDSPPFAAVTPLTPEDNAPATREMLEKVNHYPASNYVLTCNSTAFEFNAAAPGVAVLMETYEPENWRVTLDGSPVAYFRVNHAFLGVKVDVPGRHQLRFEYWPRVLDTALLLGAAGAILLLLTPLLARLCASEPPIE
jgi:hypothetical protein